MGLNTPVTVAVVAAVGAATLCAAFVFRKQLRLLPAAVAALYSMAKRKVQPVGTEHPVIVLGISGAGKSALVAKARNEPIGHIEPTSGFHVSNVSTGGWAKHTFQCTEVGGNEMLRKYWDRYYAGKHALVFVVDSAAPDDTMSLTKGAFDYVMSTVSPFMPIAIAANKQDTPDARSPEEIFRILTSDNAEAAKRCAVFGTSAVKGDGADNLLEWLSRTLV